MNEAKSQTVKLVYSVILDVDNMSEIKLKI